MSVSVKGPITAPEQFLLLLNAFIFLTGTIGNGVLIKKFYSNSVQAGSRFVLVLAVVDFITSIWIPLTMTGGIIINTIPYSTLWPFGKEACYFNTFQNALFYASSWLLVAICVERMR